VKTNVMDMRQGTWWVYFGPGGGTGIRHKLCFCTPEEAVTFSIPYNKDGSGDSWLGPTEEFLKVFKPMA